MGVVVTETKFPHRAFVHHLSHPIVDMTAAVSKVVDLSHITRPTPEADNPFKGPRISWDSVAKEKYTIIHPKQGLATKPRFVQLADGTQVSRASLEATESKSPPSKPISSAQKTISKNKQVADLRKILQKANASNQRYGGLRIPSISKSLHSIKFHLAEALGGG